MIRKTSETRALAGTVVNTYSESQTSAYSCDYINGTVLFESSSGASSGITLSDSIANYNAVEIFYHSSDNVYGNTGKIYSPSGRAISLVAPFNIDTTIYNKQARISITGTTATISDQRETAMSGGGVTVNSGTYFYINKIIGYK